MRLAFALPSLVLFSYSFPSVASQRPTPPDPATLRAKVVFYSDDGCCASGSIGFQDVKPDECIHLGVDPSIWGQGVTLEGIFYQVTNDYRAYGYGTGWKGANCTDKAFEIRWLGCNAISSDNRASSFSWKNESFPVPGPWMKRDGTLQVDHSKDATTAEKEGCCRKPDWFEYFDIGLGRTRKIGVNGSVELLTQVTDLHTQGNLESLAKLDEIW